ncbi:MAG: class I SAM-dependent methyltransferase [Deltaproteobacteria bacterium]|nr:class I SAM-dependent methyltransferase [Deltaproteobacteria bacterium]
MLLSSAENAAKEIRHSHSGKSSEGFLNRELILANLPIAPNQTILDAGCGDGYMTKEFAKRTTQGGKVYALDTNTSQIDILRKETPATNIEALVGDITKETPLAASFIDMVYLAMVIHGFTGDKMAGFLKEVKRLLKPTGTLAIVEMQKKETFFGPRLESRISPEELRNIVDLQPKQLVEIGEYFYLQLFAR